MVETHGVVPKWKRLEQLDPTYQEYRVLLGSILENPADKRTTTALEGGGAAIVLDILAGVRAIGPLGSVTNPPRFLGTDPLPPAGF